MINQYKTVNKLLSTFDWSVMQTVSVEHFYPMFYKEKQFCNKIT